MGFLKKKKKNPPAPLGCSLTQRAAASTCPPQAVTVRAMFGHSGMVLLAPPLRLPAVRIECSFVTVWPDASSPSPSPAALGFAVASGEIHLTSEAWSSSLGNSPLSSEQSGNINVA